MSHISFFLDLSRGVEGADATIESLLTQSDDGWDLCLAFSDLPGEQISREWTARRRGLRAVRAGSGAGDLQMNDLFASGALDMVGFLRPGDLLPPETVAEWRRLVANNPAVVWAVGMWTGIGCCDWWSDPALRESAPALLLLGMVPPDCAVIGAAAAWRSAAEKLPPGLRGAPRAALLVMLGFHASCVIADDIGVCAAHRSPALDAERAAMLMSCLASSDPDKFARVAVDMIRVSTGVRVAQDLLLQAAENWLKVFGPTALPSESSTGWRDATGLISLLVSRGNRDVLIWGAGEKGREALFWLRSHRVPVSGFLDSNAALVGEMKEGLPVLSAASIYEDRAKDVLIIIASMYSQEIRQVIERRGWREGEDYAVFDVHRSTVNES